MAIITLTSDMGLGDHYVSTVKGAILKQHPEANIVDITHEVKLGEITHAAFFLKNAYRHFPEGTIHIFGLSADHSGATPYVALSCDNQYFIGTDNGIFSLIFDKIPDLIVELNLGFDNDSFSFPMRDLFVKAACHLARGGTLEVIGSRIEHLNQRSLIRNIPEESVIKGTIVHIDHFENVITDVTIGMFRETGRGRPFKIFLKRFSMEEEDYIISKLSSTYSDVQVSEKLAFFNSDGLLEIAINQGNAKSLMGLRLGETIRISFQK